MRLTGEAGARVTTMRNRLIAAAVAVFTLLPGSAAPQSARAVKVIVPYPPGGGADVLVRILINQVGAMGGPTMVVENRPGAGTVIGTMDAVRSAPDGNTLLFTNNALLLAPHLRKVGYDPFASLDSICQVGSTPNISIVKSESPYRSLNDLIDAARAKPGVLTFGAGIGALSQLTYEMLMQRAGFRMTLVPYTGTLPEVEAVFAGHIDTAFVDYPPAAGLYQSGRIRALATSSASRIAWLPAVPTVSELGYQDFAVELWYGLFAPAGTPPAIESRFAAWFSKAAQVPNVRSRLAKQGIESAAVCDAPFASYLHKRFDDYGEIIRAANIKAE
jgi:tripartite-type tricarboxylate transporter receptor subunit TctC